MFKKYEWYDDFVRKPNTKIHEISPSRLCSDADNSVAMGKLFSLFRMRTSLFVARLYK